MKILELALQIRDSVFGQVFVLSILAYFGFNIAGRTRWLIVAGAVVWLALFAVSIFNLFADGND